jgi:predicted dehydrogenase
VAEYSGLNTIRIGIIGCGGIANGKHLPSLQKISGIEMVAFCDLIKERAEQAALKYGVPQAKVSVDYREMLLDSSIDVIHVLTPNAAHATITVAALEAGKHVMCEKPMAKTAKEARAMLAAAKKSGKLLTIGYQNRFRTNSTYLHGLCQDGVLGHIYYAKALALRRRAVPTWGVFLDEDQQGGGPLIDIGTHSLDLALWMMQNYRPRTVLGVTHHQLSQRENAANAWGQWDPKTFTVEDSAFGMVTMEDGANIIVESSWALNSLSVGEAQVLLCGTEAGADMAKGELRLNGEENSRLYTKSVNLEMGGVDFYEGEHKLKAADIEARQWIQAVRDGGSPVVKPEEALVVTEILEAIYESARTHQAVSLVGSMIS